MATEPAAAAEPAADPAAGPAAAPPAPTERVAAPYGTPGATLLTIPAPTGPTVGTRVASMVRGIPAERFIAAAIAPVVVYAATWLVALVFTLLVFVAAADASLDWGLAFQAPAQIVGLAVAGTLTIGATVMGISAAVSVLWLPLLVTAFLIIATAFVARRDERIAPSRTRGIRWLLSALSGVVLAILVVIVAAVTPLTYVLGDGSENYLGFTTATGTATSASFTAFLGALVLGTLASYVARARVARAAAGITPAVVAPAATTVFASVRSTLPVVGLHLGVLAVLVTLGLLVWSVINGGVNALLTAFFWLPTAVVDGLGFVNLAPLTFGGSLAALGGLTGSSNSFWMPAELPGWATVLILVANLLLILVTGTVLRLRRGQLRLSAAMSWVTTVVSFAVAGIVISIVGGIGGWTSVDTAGAGESLDGLLAGAGSLIEGAAAASGVVGLAAWTFIVFAALGALVEVVAVFAAPTLVQLLPAAVLTRSAKITGLVGVPFAVPGTYVLPEPTKVPAASAAPGATGEPVGSGEPAVVLPQHDGVTATVPMTPEKKRRVRIVLAAVGAGVVVVLGASIAVSIVNQMVYSPQNQVESYLDALVAGDASAAVAIGDVDGSGEQGVLLTDKVLKATEGRITGFTITDVSTAGDTATVTADIDLDGVKEDASYTLTKSGKTALFFDNWTLDPVWLPTVSVSVAPGIESVDVNGTVIELTSEVQESGYLEVLAFAGDYVIGSAGDAEWLAAEPQTVQVGMVVSSGSAQLKLEPTAKFTSSIDEQVAEYLAGCAAQKVLNADDCPIYVFDYGTITDVVWTIDEPAVTSLGNSYKNEWYLATEDRGSATVTYTNTDYRGQASPETATMNFSVNGTVKMVDGAPVFSNSY
ncbi:hypothetical protein [Cryobacterium sp. LW097]|uniref:hypothetical protein n=1 Tax=Cryobacterium sp. LW097 TaxID=1978566 RepID=UPI001243EA67|nr:hypothetical protein [Cryobacterium sp. LW097]